MQEESKFIFVPGPGDPGPANVLPRPALPAYFTADLRQLLPTAVFASNPCRLRLYTQQVVLFRSNLQNHMRRLCLIPPTCKSDRLGTNDSCPFAAAIVGLILSKLFLCCCNSQHRQRLKPANLSLRKGLLRPFNLVCNNQFVWSAGAQAVASLYLHTVQMVL